MSCSRNPSECKNLEKMVGACGTDGLQSASTIHEYKVALIDCICDSESEIQCTCRRKVARTLLENKSH